MTGARPDKVETGAVNVPGRHPHGNASPPPPVADGGAYPHGAGPLNPPRPIPWAAARIAAAAGPVPAYGSPAWAALPDDSPVKVAACVIAAECWRIETDPARIAERLRVELAAARAEDEAPGMWSADVVDAVHRTARRPSYAELCRRRGEPEAEARAVAHERRMEELMTHGT